MGAQGSRVAASDATAITYSSNQTGISYATQQTYFTATAADALSSIFGDQEISDIVLKGSDGGEVYAVKAILASRSAVFRHKLYSSNKDDFPKNKLGKDIVEIKNFDCRILHLVVEYCYTDDISIAKVDPNDDIARLMANMGTASKAFKLPGLMDKVTQWIWRNVNRHPALACAIIDEGMQHDDIEESALQILQLKVRNSLLPDARSVGGGVLSLSKPGLLFVLRTLEDMPSHLLLYEAIKRWVEFSPVDLGTTGPDANHKRERASREAFARKCAMRFIKPSKISSDQLDRVMQDSGLFKSGSEDSRNTKMMNSGLQFSDPKIVQQYSATSQ
jgi:hypothetical protein